MEEKEKPSNAIALSGLVVSVFAFVVSLSAFGFSVYTNYQSTELQKKTVAFTYWQTYLQLSLSNPDLAEAKVNESDIKTKLKYPWFVATALGSAEAVYDLQQNDPGWKEVIKNQIRMHRKYVESKDFKRDHYSKPFRDLIDEVLREPATEN